MSMASLKLAAFDGGGLRCFSQLVLLRKLMYELTPDGQEHPLPYKYFDLIGGSDAGGIIAILLVKLGMSLEEAIDDFGFICEEVYLKRLPVEEEPVGTVEKATPGPKMRKLTATERTENLRSCMHGILGKRNLPLDLKLEEKRQDGQCLGFVIAASAHNVANKRYLRTYCARGEPPTNVTVVDAALATCASPGEFLPVPIGPTRWEKHPHIGAGLGANNPTGRLLAEATSCFPGARHISLLSIGSGHHGVLSLDSTNGDAGLYRLMLDMLKDAEKHAQEIHEQISGQQNYNYLRFSVDQGMQKGYDADAVENGPLGWISAQTEAYLSLPTTRDLVRGFVNILCPELAPAEASSNVTLESGVSQELDGRTTVPAKDSPHMIEKKGQDVAPPQYHLIIKGAPQPRQLGDPVRVFAINITNVVEPLPTQLLEGLKPPVKLSPEYQRSGGAASARPVV